MAVQVVPLARVIVAVLVPMPGGTYLSVTPETPEGSVASTETIDEFGPQLWSP